MTWNPLFDKGRAKTDVVRHYCVHPIWFDASDEELAWWLRVPPHEVHRVREEPDVVDAVNTLHASDARPR